MRSEHKDNVRDVQSNMFHLPRKYSKFCVIFLKWDNRYKNLYSKVSSFIWMEGHLYYISLDFSIIICFWIGANIWASRMLPRSLTTHHYFLHESIAMQGCAKVTWRMVLWSSLAVKIKTCCHVWDVYVVSCCCQQITYVTVQVILGTSKVGRTE